MLDGEGRPNFQRLQKRGLRVRLADVQHAAAASPATLFVFDLLGVRGFRSPAAAARRAQGDPAPRAAAGRRLDPPHRGDPGARRGPLRRRRRHGAGGDRRQARRLPLPLRVREGLAEGAGRPELGLRGGRLRAGGAGARPPPAPPRGRGAAAGSPTPARWAPASAARWRARSASGSIRCAAPARRCRWRTSAARSGSSPSWWSRSATRSGPTAGTCATPSSCACATTRRPPSVSVREKSGRSGAGG